jgi:hypothetical protein
MVEIYPFPDCCPEAFSNSSPVIGMDALLEFFKLRRSSCGFEAGYAEYFFGPVGMFAERRHKCPTARVTQPLRFRKISLASPQDFFRVSVLGDIRDSPNKFWRPRLIPLRRMANDMNMLN